MRRILTVFIVVAGLVAAVVAQDTDEIANFSAKAARVNRGQLTAASNAARPDIVSGFLRGRHDAATIASLVTDSENPTADGPVHLKMHQRVAGLDVYGTYVRRPRRAVDGQLLSVIENLAPAGPASRCRRASTTVTR